MAEIGHTQYIDSGGEGFSCVFKQRYSDFIVREVTPSGRIVRLRRTEHYGRTGGGGDKAADALDESVLAQCQAACGAHVCDDDWQRMAAVLRGQAKLCDIDCASLDKSARTLVHENIRLAFTSRLSSTTNTDKIVVSRATGRSRQRHSGADFCHFTLYKENKETHAALGIIARLLRVKSGSLSVAGTKDRRSASAQRVSAYRVGAERLSQLNKTLRGMTLADFEAAERPLKLGDTAGNRFVVTLRNVTGADGDAIESMVHEWTQGGFINYYGHQRFGSSPVSTASIGLALLKNEFSAAVDLILDERNDADDAHAARKVWSQEGDAARALAALRHRHCVEADVLSVLKQRKNDCKAAVFAVARNTRNLYAHSYQSLVWNKAVSRRLQSLGPLPVAGDLVFVDKESTSVRPLESDELSQYAISDVVLPLPSADMQLPANELAQCYDELLAEDGLKRAHFQAKQNELALGGSYRKVVQLPQCVRWRTARYDEASDALAPTDLDLLAQTADGHDGEPANKRSKLEQGVATGGEQHELGHVEGELGTRTSEGGKYVAVVLAFSLPAGSYATMALRQLTRMDFSKGHQSTLNNYAHPAHSDTDKETSVDQ